MCIQRITWTCIKGSLVNTAGNYRYSCGYGKIEKFNGKVALFLFLKGKITRDREEMNRMNPLGSRYFCFELFL